MNTNGTTNIDRREALRRAVQQCPSDATSKQVADYADKHFGTDLARRAEGTIRKFVATARQEVAQGEQLKSLGNRDGLSGVHFYNLSAKQTNADEILLPIENQPPSLAEAADFVRRAGGFTAATALIDQLAELQV